MRRLGKAENLKYKKLRKLEKTNADLPVNFEASPFEHI